MLEGGGVRRLPPRSRPETLEECWALIDRLYDAVEELMGMVQWQRQRIEALERRLDQTSQNSSRPPSSDPPSVKKPPPKKPSGRKPGGQPGHEGHHRELLPAEEVDEVVEHWPETCDGCHDPLPANLRVEVGDPTRHQVTELPEAPAVVTEHRLHTQQCACGWATEAQLPDGVPRGAFGPRLASVVALFTGCYRMTDRMVEEAVHDVFHVRISLGSVVACQQATSQAVATPVEEARAYVQQQPVAFADETGWTERRKKAWLWVMATSLVTVFLIHRRRSREAARELLGQFLGILVSDRWSVYKIHQGLRQICWAHLARDFQAMSEYRGKVGRLGKELVRLTLRMLRWWGRVRDGPMTRAEFQRRMKPLRRRVEYLLQQAVVSGRPRVAGMAWDIAGVHREALWTFVDVAGVEPTNNNAERPLRHAVLWRRSSHGTHSEKGSRFVERMLTVRATLRAQHRNVLGYVTQAVEASMLGLPAPSLLPQRSRRELALAA